MIRLAVPADRPAVEEVVREAYAPWVEIIGARPLPMLADYAALIDAGHVWVLEPLDGVIVLIPEDDDLLVDNVAVRPSAQGRGLGLRLLAFAEDRAGELGLPALRLITNERMTTNIARYTSLGYVETGREDIRGRYVVHMRKNLGISGTGAR